MHSNLKVVGVRFDCGWLAPRCFSVPETVGSSMRWYNGSASNAPLHQTQATLMQTQDCRACAFAWKVMPAACTCTNDSWNVRLMLHGHLLQEKRAKIDESKRKALLQSPALLPVTLAITNNHRVRLRFHCFGSLQDCTHKMT